MNLKIQSLVTREIKGFRGSTEVLIAKSQVQQPIAEFAMGLIERWGMVAADIDEKEDTAGRSKLRLMAPKEVVDRACETALLAFEAFAARDWLADIPIPTPESEHKAA